MPTRAADCWSTTPIVRYTFPVFVSRKLCIINLASRFYFVHPANDTAGAGRLR